MTSTDNVKFLFEFFLKYSSIAYNEFKDGYVGDIYSQICCGILNNARDKFHINNFDLIMDKNKSIKPVIIQQIIDFFKTHGGYKINKDVSTYSDIGLNSVNQADSKEEIGIRVSDFLASSLTFILNNMMQDEEITTILEKMEEKFNLIALVSTLDVTPESLGAKNCFNSWSSFP